MTSFGKLRFEGRGDREVVMTRRFDAPREAVFDGFTKAELLQQWLVPPGWEVTRCEIDLRPGGSYRYEWRGPDGKPMGTTGVIREVQAPASLVQTERFEPTWYPGEAVGTLELVEENGVTTAVHTMRYESREARDMVLAAPMGEGAAASYDMLEQLLRGGALAAGAAGR